MKYFIDVETDGLITLRKQILNKVIDISEDNGECINSKWFMPILAISIIDEDANVVFEGRLSDSALNDIVVDDWVKINIVPNITPIKYKYPNIESLVVNALNPMLFNMRDNVEFVAHCGYILEGGLFNYWSYLKNDGSRIFKRPMILHELGTLLSAIGEDPYSDDKYIDKYLPHFIEDAPDYIKKMKLHHPTYDNYRSLVIWKHITEGILQREKK